jgi:hypothetical protein
METRRAAWLLVMGLALVLGWSLGYPVLARVLFEGGRTLALGPVEPAIAPNLDQTLAAQLLTENAHTDFSMTEGARARRYSPVETVMFDRIMTGTLAMPGAGRVVPLTSATPRGAQALPPPPRAIVTPTRDPATPDSIPPP